MKVLDVEGMTIYDMSHMSRIKAYGYRQASLVVPKTFIKSTLPYLACMYFFAQSLIGFNEIVSLRSIYFPSEFEYGPTVNEQALPEEILVSEIAPTPFDTYSYEEVKSYSRLLNPLYISRVDKEVFKFKLLSTLPSTIRKRAKLYIDDILVFSEKNQLDPLWVLSIIWTESHFKPYASSRVKATGLMQIMPGTGRFLSRLLKRPSDKKLVDQLLVDPRTNVELGTYYLKRLLRRFGSHKLATIAYNMGPGFVSYRLRNGGALGVKNDYLNKVNKRYSVLLRSIHISYKKSRILALKSFVLRRKGQEINIDHLIGRDIARYVSSSVASM